MDPAGVDSPSYAEPMELEVRKKDLGVRSELCYIRGEHSRAFQTTFSLQDQATLPPGCKKGRCFASMSFTSHFISQCIDDCSCTIHLQVELAGAAAAAVPGPEPMVMREVRRQKGDMITAV